MSESIHEGDDVELPQEEPVAEASEPASEPAEEPQAEAPAEEETPAEPVPTVPLAALNEARAQTRELREELRQQREVTGTLKDQLDEWRKANQTVQSQIDYETDPLGALRNDIQTIAQQQQSQQEAQQAQQAQQAAAQELQSTMASHVQAFTKDHPDYHDALGFMLEKRGNELRLMGVPEDQVERTIATESMQLAQSAISRGLNAAELVYGLAQTRGYTPGKASPKPDAASQIQNIAEGQAKATKVPQGGEEDRETTLGDIEKMSDEEFDKYWEKQFGSDYH